MNRLHSVIQQQQILGFPNIRLPLHPYYSYNKRSMLGPPPENIRYMQDLVEEIYKRKKAYDNAIRNENTIQGRNQRMTSEKNAPISHNYLKYSNFITKAYEFGEALHNSVYERLRAFYYKYNSPNNNNFIKLNPLHKKEVVRLLLYIKMYKDEYEHFNIRKKTMNKIKNLKSKHSKLEESYKIHWKYYNQHVAEIKKQAEERQKILEEEREERKSNKSGGNNKGNGSTKTSSKKNKSTGSSRKSFASELGRLFSREGKSSAKNRSVKSKKIKKRPYTKRRQVLFKFR